MIVNRDVWCFTYGVVLAATLSAVHAFLGESVANALQGAALAELAADEVVDAILSLVNGLDAGDLGLVESVCCRSMSVLNIDHVFIYVCWSDGTYP